MKIKKFHNFQPSAAEFTRKVGLIGESNTLPELYGDKDADVVLTVSPNAFSTHQVFSRLSGSPFVPQYVSNKLAAQSLKLPITVISPVSEIRTFSTMRQLNREQTAKNSMYLSRPRINSQYQVTAHEGKIIGARQVIDGKPIHLNLNRFPKATSLQEIAEGLYGNLKSDLLRFRVGDTKNGPILLAMENFKLKVPELTSLYFKIYENFIGPMPEWFKHNIETSVLVPYLYEYVNREETAKRCPYML